MFRKITYNPKSSHIRFICTLSFGINQENTHITQENIFNLLYHLKNKKRIPQDHNTLYMLVSCAYAFNTIKKQTTHCVASFLSLLERCLVHLFYFVGCTHNTHKIQNLPGK